MAVLVHADDAEEAPVKIVLSERLPESGRGGVEALSVTAGGEVQEGPLGIQ